MVDSVKNYGIAGLSGNVELGKSGPRVIDSSTQIEMRENGGGLNRVEIADAVDDDHAITKGQLEGIKTNRVYSNVVSYDSGVSNMMVLPAGSTVLSVSVERISNWTGSNSSTNIVIGDSADNNRLFTNFCATTATVDETNHFYANQTTITSTVTAGGANSGTARILILYSGGTALEAPETEIDETTEINIFFDSSGSMNSTLSPLRTMRAQVLKDALLPFYGNDEDAYDNNVTITEDPSERVWEQMRTLGSNSNVTSVINLVFSDENSPYGAGSSYPTNSTSVHDTDIANLRSTISTAETANGDAYYRSVMFQVATANGAYAGYKQYLQNVFTGGGNYSGTSGLSDRNDVELNLLTDIIPGANATYYANQIISGLNELGYSIPSVSYD